MNSLKNGVTNSAELFWGNFQKEPKNDLIKYRQVCIFSI